MDEGLNASERPLSRSVIVNRPKVLIGRSQKGHTGRFVDLGESTTVATGPAGLQDAASPSTSPHWTTG